MASPTPGPWRVEVNKAPCATSWVIVADGDRPYIGATYGPRDHALANAHLIAAAPDLLAACEGLIEMLGGSYDADTFAVQYLAAQLSIAKARGEVPPC